MRELSIFVDESGDFGPYDYHSPYYIISLVFHEQDTDIVPAIQYLDKELRMLGLPDLCIHTGPIIRREESFRDMDINTRRRIFNKMIAFVRQLGIKTKCIYIEKKHYTDIVEATGRLSRQIALFVMENMAFFRSFDTVKIYYDNGQIELSKILSSVFNTLLPDPVFKKVMPANYKLFQVADLVCTMKLVELKMDAGAFSRSESEFFHNLRDLRKNYLKVLKSKEF